jgi:hypothetical protein
MKRTAFAGTMAMVSLALFTPRLSAQVLHVDNRWDNCAIVIDPALTQDAWHQFVKEVGLVAYFRPLAAARPLGPRHFEFGILQWGTQIDDTDPAWNDTFSHPDATHWLFDGNALRIPGFMLRMGVTQRLDLGAYWTTAPGANYGMLAGHAQYNFLDDLENGWAASGRLSALRLYGPDDMKVGTYGLDLVASKEIDRFTPYAGVGAYWSRGHEATSKVALEDESVVGVQGMVGANVRVWLLRLAAEFNLASVPGYSFKVAFSS